MKITFQAMQQAQFRYPRQRTTTTMTTFSNEWITENLIVTKLDSFLLFPNLRLFITNLSEVTAQLCRFSEKSFPLSAQGSHPRLKVVVMAINFVLLLLLLLCY